MKKPIYRILITVSILISFNSCSNDFGDTNINPQVVTTNTFNSALTTVIEGVRYRSNYGESTFLQNEVLYPATELTTLIRNIGVDPITNSSGSIWSSYYKFLSHYREFERLKEAYTGDISLVEDYFAMADILLATKTLHVSTLFGDMPYSEAGLGFSNSNRIFRPKFDAQREIFMSLIEKIENAVSTLETQQTSNGEQKISPGASDVLLGGDREKWQKFGNAVLLKLAMLIVDKDQSTSSSIITRLMSDNVPMLGEGDDIRFVPGDLDYVLRVANTFRAAGSNGVRMGETVWNQMSSDPADSSGASIFDYRAFVFFSVNANDQWVAAPQNIQGELSDVGDVYHPRRRKDPKNGASNYSAVNINFLFEGSVRPEIIISNEEIQFLKSEIYARGIGVAQDWTKAEEHYVAGIKSSLMLWSGVAQNISEWNIGRPEPISTEFIESMLSTDKVKFLDTDDDMAKLKKIYAQHWISLFWQPVDAFHLMRRTELTPRTDPSQIKNFKRLTYPIEEQNNNPDNYTQAVQNMGSDDTTTNQYWMK